MKQSGKTLLGISAAVAIAIATVSTVYAKSANQPSGQRAMMDNSSAMMHGQKGNMGDKFSRMSEQKGMMGGHGNMMKMMSGEKGMMGMMGNSKAHMDKRLAKARYALNLTRNQLPTWNAYAKAVRAQVNLMSTRIKQTQGGAQSSTTVDQRATLMNSRAERMQKTAAAARNLYQKLTQVQRAKANRLLPIPCSRS